MLDIFAPFKWEALFQRWPDILSAFGMTVGISVLALLIALVLGVVFGALNLVGTFLGGADASSIVNAVVSLVLPITCVILANNIKHQEMRW